MKTAIIVPTYNRPLMVRRLLQSLEQCSLEQDLEIIVVENGKRCGTEEECITNPIGGRVRYLFVEAASRSKALNEGIKATDAQFFIFFDDDLTFPSEIVAVYIAAAKRYGRSHFFGGPLVADAEISCPDHLIPFLPPSCIDWSLGQKEIFIDQSFPDMFFGANWAGFREDFERFGYFSQELGVSATKLSPLGEETSLQQTFLNSGVRGVYLPEAVIYHFVQRECYTRQWIRTRKLRHGITDYIMHIRKDQSVRKIKGIPTWVIRAVLEQYCRLVISFILLKGIRQRTAILMRISYLSGIILSAVRNESQAPTRLQNIHLNRLEN